MLWYMIVCGYVRSTYREHLLTVLSLQHGQNFEVPFDGKQRFQLAAHVLIFEVFGEVFVQEVGPFL